MNLRQLYYFKKIAELEHYTRAAKELFVSQSSLSHAIQELESELNVKFFVKKGRNVELTKYGRLFLPYVQQTIDTLEAGLSKLEDYINPNTGTVVMAGFPSLAQFARTSSCATCPRPTGWTCACSSTRRPPIRSCGSSCSPAMVHQGHRLARNQAVDLRELDGENFIAFSKDSQLRGVTDQIFRELGIHPIITMETAQDLIMHGLVAANHGVAIIPYPLGGAPYNTKILPISNDIPPRHLYLSWNKEQYLPPAAEYFRDFIIRSGEVFTQFIQKSGLPDLP